MRTHKQIAWEAWLTSYLQANKTTLKDLGLGWTGFGGENQLKEAFHKWYDTAHLEPFQN